ncbi:MAG: DUF1640 domain-containing protein [Sphingomonadaceae bacterium]|nr:DUF1640 domain-containing protein [Sphingomonadaceae bacterium]
MIDTLKLARNFETAGFATPQAEALTAALVDLRADAREDLATRDDLKAGMSEVRAEIRESRTESKSDLRVAVADLKIEIATAVSSSQNKILWALFGSQLFVIAAVVALNNLSKLIP